PLTGVLKAQPAQRTRGAIAPPQQPGTSRIMPASGAGNQSNPQVLTFPQFTSYLGNPANLQLVGFGQSGGQVNGQFGGNVQSFTGVGNFSSFGGNFQSFTGFGNFNGQFQGFQGQFQGFNFGANFQGFNGFGNAQGFQAFGNFGQFQGQFGIGNV